MHRDRMQRCRRTSQRLGFRREGRERFSDLLRRGRRAPGEPDGEAGGVSVYDGHAIARGGDPQGVSRVHVECFYGDFSRWGLNGRRVSFNEPSEDLEHLPLHFFLFATDVGDYIICDIEGADAWVPRTGDRLHRCDEE